MALIIAETATALSTTNGFYRVESYNQDFSSITGYQVGSTTALRRNQSMTFANAGNLRGIIIGVFFNGLTPSSGYNSSYTVELHEAKTASISIASPAVITSTSHGLSADQLVQFSTTGTLPTGITANQPYYVLSTGLTQDVFRISLTLNGPAINTSVSQTGTHTLWVIRSSKTRTGSDLRNNCTYCFGGMFVKPFKFDTPYPVDTTASKWRFQVYAGSATITNSYIAANSASTSISYFAWCDTQATFSSGNDTIVAAAPVTIDMTATFKAMTYMTYAGINYAVCAFACSSDTPAYNQNGMFVWQTPTLASYTLTLDGYMILPTHAGFHIGNESYSIPISVKANIIAVQTPSSTSATLGYSSFGSPWLGNYYYDGGATIMWYGEVPAQRKCTLTADSSISSTVLTVDNNTGFISGDKLFITKMGAITTTYGTEYTVVSTSGSTIINITPAISTSIRKTGGFVVKPLDYGIIFSYENWVNFVSFARPRFEQISNFLLNGVCSRNIYWGVSAFNGVNAFFDDLANHQTSGSLQVTNCVFYNYNNNGYYYYGGNQWCSTSLTDALIDNCYFLNVTPPISPYKHTNYNSNYSVYGGDMTISNCIIANSAGTATGYSTSTGLKLTVKNNIIHNGVGAFTIAGSNSEYTNNYCYGTTYAVKIGNAFYCTINTGNIFDLCTYICGLNDGTGAARTVIGCYESGNSYTNITYGPYFYADSVLDYEINNMVGNVPALDSTSTISQLVLNAGSYFRVTSSNQVANADYGYKYSGNIVRTGDGLADTTVHTSGTGKFAMRMQSLSSVNNLIWSQNIPTGNIQNKDMTVGIWVKLNSATYWGGSAYQLPRLTVTYDSTTTVYVEAAQTTDWQYMYISFRPATTNSQIVATLSCRTDATLTNTYVYWDDMSILYPAGVTLSLGGLDIWASGLPAMPSISTLSSAQDVWSADPTIFGTNTIGNTINQINQKIDDAGTLNF